MDYQAVDPVIRAWVEKHGFKLFERVGGSDKPHRFVYLSSAEGECFQIWVDAPKGDSVEVHAGDIETKNDEEMRKDWSVTLSQLGTTLEAAVAQVRGWMKR